MVLYVVVQKLVKMSLKSFEAISGLGASDTALCVTFLSQVCNGDSDCGDGSDER